MTYQEATKVYQINLLMIDYYEKKKIRLLVPSEKQILEIDRTLLALYHENYELEHYYFKTTKKETF